MTTTKNSATCKEIQTMTAAIGSALSAADKLAAVTTAKETASPAFRLVLADYIHANRNAIGEKALKAAGLSDDEAVAVMFSANCLYRAAINAANVQHKADEAKKANNALFTEWKGFLSLLAGETVKAASSDREALVNAATRKAKEAITYRTRTNQAGELVAAIDTGVTHSAAVSFTAFLKEAERLAVERILGFDGIVSLNDSKAMQATNATLKEASLNLATNGTELVQAS